MAEEKFERTGNLEEKVGVLDRLKYVALPLAMAAGAYFTPELRSRYDSLSEDKRHDYKMLALGGAVLAGSLIAVSSGRGLYREHKKNDAAHRKNAAA